MSNQEGFFRNALRERGFFKNELELPADRSPWSLTIVFILFAYLLSFSVRLEWIDFAQANYLDKEGNVSFIREDMVMDGIALPNTHDSFYFGSILQKAHLGMHKENHLIPSHWKSGMITVLPYFLLQIFPFLTIELLLLWLPVYVAGLVCIPIVLIGRLYGCSIWGFLAACLAGVTHSYYNRTLAGYYDTDMFSITIPAFALYFLLGASRRESMGFAFAAALTLYLYRFFYASGQSITGSLVVAFVGYRILLFTLDLLTKKKSTECKVFSSESTVFTLKAGSLVSFAGYAESWSNGSMVDTYPLKFFLGLVVLLGLYLLFCFALKDPFSKTNHSKVDKIPSGIRSWILPSIFLGLLGSSLLGSDMIAKIFAKLDRYRSAGEGVAMTSSAKGQGYSLSYLDVFSTVREASDVPKRTVLNRILSDFPSCNCPRCLAGDKDKFTFPTSILGLFGLILLIFRYWEFCLIAPFVAIAYYCYNGDVGLRFTVHVGNVAAIGVVFLLLVTVGVWMRKFFKKKENQEPFSLWKRQALWSTWGIVLVLCSFLLYPNLKHARNYNSHVVYPIKTIEVLEKMKEASKPDDFVVTWWDYGSGCWFYGDTRTFTSPANQTFDNFLTSSILRSTSAMQVRNLSRLKTETFVRLQNEREEGKQTYATAVEAIFNDGTPDLKFYQGFLEDLKKPDALEVVSSRDVFFFLPYEILRIFPTILSFSSRNLYFSKNFRERPGSNSNPPLKILKNGRREGSSLVFDDGFIFDKKGNLRLNARQKGMIPYSQLWRISADGEPAFPVSELKINGLKIPAYLDPLSSMRLIFIDHMQQMVLISSKAFNSTFAKRFLIDEFDRKAFEHPLFEFGASPITQPYFIQADWVTQKGSSVFLNMRGGYRIEADLSSNLVKLPSMKNPVPFEFHRNMHEEKSGKLTKYPKKEIDNARFHLIQTNIPVFLGENLYSVADGGESVEKIAEKFGLPVEAFVDFSSEQRKKMLKPDEVVEIPAKGYELRQAWFFMDQNAYDSFLVKGFLREELSTEHFTKVFSTPWGKVYKLK